MLNKEFGGSVHPKEAREDGQFTITIDTNCSLFRYDKSQWWKPRVSLL